MTRFDSHGLSVPRIELAPGYSISSIINGCWQLSAGHGGNLDSETDVFNRFSELVEAGFTTFDCADIYTGVESLLGRYIRKKNAHHAIQVHTKFVPDLSSLSSINHESVESIIDRSLSRLGLERLDLVQFHWWDYSIPAYLDVLGILDSLRQKGKIRLLGLTNFDCLRLEEIVSSGISISSLQLQYSVLDRRPEKGMTALCMKNEIGLLTYGVLAGGLLNDRWLGQAKPGGDNRSLQKYLLMVDEAGGWGRFQSLLECLRKVATVRETSISSIAVSYLAGKTGVVAVILGVGSNSRLSENLKLANLVLSDNDRAAIDEVLIEFPVPDGDVFKLERLVDGKHARNMKMNLNEEKS